MAASRDATSVTLSDTREAIIKNLEACLEKVEKEASGGSSCVNSVQRIDWRDIWVRWLRPAAP